MLKLGVIIGSFTSFYGICQNTDYFRGLLLLRLGRTAFTISSMVIDYKLFFRNSQNYGAEYSQLLSEVHQVAANKLLNLTLINGGCFIKIGQHIGTLTYLLPDEYVNTLKILHSDVPEEPFEKVCATIKDELKKEPSDIFMEISSKPLGTASLAQVHWGRLKETGEEVAIKVQYKEVRNHSYNDILCMDVFFYIVCQLFPQMNLEWLADETRKNLPQELNFIKEGENAETLKTLISTKLPFLKIPKIHWNYTTEKILVMEYCNGNKVDDKEYLIKNNLSAEQISRDLCKLYCEMIFRHGFVHCDPHPGNILICPSNSLTNNRNIISRIWNKLFGLPKIQNAQIVLLDHGLYQTLSDEFLSHYCRLWLAMISKDEATIKKEGDALGCPDQFHRLLACMVSGRSWETLSSGTINKEFSTTEGDYIRETANMFIPHMMLILNSVPREMLLILKTNDLLRGIEHSLLGRPYSKATMAIWSTTKYCMKRNMNDSILLIHTQNSFLARLYKIEIVLKYYLSRIYIFIIECILR